VGWQAQIFAYCERGTNAAFWAEPLNAVSNAIVFVIGIGSFLFHTYATRWAALADTLPITVFMLVYLFYALVRFVGLSILAAAVWLLVFVGSLAAAETARCGGGACLNGSLGYVPALAVLGLIGALLAVRGHPAGRPVLLGAGVFLVSLTLRTVDRGVCPFTIVSGRAVGTHFLWHMLNATLLYILLHAAILHGRAGRMSVKLASAELRVKA
jgi:hypothetical protein